MTIYEVIDWDWMDGSMGNAYVHSRYLIETEAQEKAAELNEQARAYWMATCSEEGRKNYRDKAHVNPVEVK